MKIVVALSLLSMLAEGCSQSKLCNPATVLVTMDCPAGFPGGKFQVSARQNKTEFVALGLPVTAICPQTNLEVKLLTYIEGNSIDVHIVPVGTDGTRWPESVAHATLSKDCTSILPEEFHASGNDGGPGQEVGLDADSVSLDGGIANDDTASNTCSVGGKRCSGQLVESCEATGWVPELNCPFVCKDGTCSGDCAHRSRQCNGNTPEVCNEFSKWRPEQTCSTICELGQCAECAAICPALTNASASCTSSKCSYSCTALGYENCETTSADCETKINGNDAGNCGGCGLKCLGTLTACLNGGCVACSPGSMRPCSADGKRGTCAGGTETCNSLGNWSTCSIQPAPTDSCTPDNDDSCDGSPLTGCICDGLIMPNPVSTGLPNPVSYDNSVAGNVTDNVTGLQWQKSAFGMPMSHAVAVVQCSGLGSGWRLPSFIELVSILDLTHINPTIDTSAFPGTASANFWTSTPTAGSVNNMWVVGFSYGDTRNNDVAISSQVRCMRKNSPRCYPSSRFSVLNGGLIFDAMTRLTWQQNTAPTTKSWNEGKSYCATVGSGFRLPSLKEIFTLLDTGKPPGVPLIDTAVFSGTPASTFWTSSPLAGSSVNALTISFSNGFASYSPIETAMQVRCVK